MHENKSFSQWPTLPLRKLCHVLFMIQKREGMELAEIPVGDLIKIKWKQDMSQGNSPAFSCCHGVIHAMPSDMSFKHTLPFQRLRVSKIFFRSKEYFIQQGCIKLIKSDSKDILVKKLSISNKCDLIVISTTHMENKALTNRKSF